MRRTRSESWLLLLVLPVLGFGLFHAWHERARQLAPHPHYKWFNRYSQLEPILGDVPRVAIVHNPETHKKGKAKLFKVQYVLAPTIVELRRQLPRPRPKRLETIPLIYDFERPRILRQVLAKTAAKAEKKGVTMTVEHVDRGLAVVRMRKD